MGIHGDEWRKSFKNGDHGRGVGYSSPWGWLSRREMSHGWLVWLAKSTLSEELRNGLKMLLQVGEFFYLQQAYAIRRWIDALMLQDPGIVMRDKDGIDAGGHGGVDV
jgi:hypothetical protein